MMIMYEIQQLRHESLIPRLGGSYFPTPDVSLNILYYFLKKQIIYEKYLSVAFVMEQCQFVS